MKKADKTTRPQTRSGKVIETAGLTRQRRCVLDVVCASSDHPTAREVYARAQRKLPGISFATVYNSLRYLTAQAQISELTFGNGASRFDRRTERHDHAICNGCGAIADLELAETANLLRAAARRSRYKPESIHLTLYGL